MRQRERLTSWESANLHTRFPRSLCRSFSYGHIRGSAVPIGEFGGGRERPPYFGAQIGHGGVAQLTFARTPPGRVAPVPSIPGGKAFGSPEGVTGGGARISRSNSTGCTAVTTPGVLFRACRLGAGARARSSVPDGPARRASHRERVVEQADLDGARWLGSVTPDQLGIEGTDRSLTELLSRSASGRGHVAIRGRRVRSRPREAKNIRFVLVDRMGGRASP